jgi:hypothetical protein
MKQEELDNILKTHAAWLKGQPEGSRAYLIGAYLRGANLKGADLGRAYLGRANLIGAYLRGADLGGANLEGADLGGADLRGADLGRAYLGRANLIRANLRRANLIRANLEGANLEGANLDFSAFPLWCGSFGIKCDTRLFAQLAYHMCRLDVPEELKKYQEALREIAVQFHRYEECGELPSFE